MLKRAVCGWRTELLSFCLGFSFLQYPFVKMIDRFVTWLALLLSFSVLRLGESFHTVEIESQLRLSSQDLKDAHQFLSRRKRDASDRRPIPTMVGYPFAHLISDRIIDKVFLRSVDEFYAFVFAARRIVHGTALLFITSSELLFTLCCNSRYFLGIERFQKGLCRRLETELVGCISGISYRA